MKNLAHLQTPAFLVDKNIVKQNCDRMREKARASGVAFRPHAKTHKTVEVARMQHGGTTGPITVSTLAEAEFLADAGFRDITYAFPIDIDKLDRVHALAGRIDRLNILIDNAEALRGLERHRGVFDVFLKVDCGYHRAGVNPDDPESVKLAIAIAKSTAVRFHGILTHAGHSYHARSVAEILPIAEQESAALSRFRGLLPGELKKTMRSIGSTPTLSVVNTFTNCDEVRPGNYVFYDAFQATIGACRFEDVAVSVLATVVGSYPDRNESIIDAGALAMSKDAGPDHVDPHFGYGIVCDLDLKPLDVRLIALSQEHGKIAGTLPAGSRVRVVPNHSCLTAAMYDAYHVLEGGEVVDEWRPVRGW
jgi:D-serine deaminase-like pyridoxal phosphate-dependent protein